MARDQVQGTRSVSTAPNAVCGSRIRTKPGNRHATPTCAARSAAPSPARCPAYPTPATDRTPATAYVFAERTARAVLEVLDRRRPVKQLAAWMSPDVHARLRTLVDAELAPSRRLGPAVLVRIDVVIDDGPDAEIFARYRRGPRYLALAGRITHTRRHGWRLTALRIG
ncbi:Rv3235 family protein [Nocardia cyriacigeorgica]|uniref:Rv3235 family protein n=1 Tax=Nocardia cyriacigeorgica TaxID=135487 RepID=UPI0024584B37|nr:Rv3235 family protein [Nocardia cyriacigeorgica]